MKKLISATLAASLALSLAACGSSASTDSVAASSEAASTESTAASSEAAESTAETSELAGTTLKVAASPTPHAEILNVAKEVLAEQGIDLEVVEFSDYVQPNLVTESGEVVQIFPRPTAEPTQANTKPIELVKLPFLCFSIFPLSNFTILHFIVLNRVTKNP